MPSPLMSGGPPGSVPQAASSASKSRMPTARPTRDFDAQWGGGFLEPDKWVGIVYDGTVK